jgi:ADP-heptose:LPS heptosyltransferase
VIFRPAGLAKSRRFPYTVRMSATANTERANRRLRRLDALLGVPLVNALSLARRPPEAAAPDLPAPGRIAVLCFGAIGDTLLATTLLRALAALYPNAEIRLLASDGNAQVLPLLGPRFKTAAFPIRSVWAMARHLRALRPDLLIDTTQWARVGALVTLLSGVRHTIGFDTPGQRRGAAYAFPVRHRNDCHETENFLALARVIDPAATASPGLFLPDEPPPGLDVGSLPPSDNIVYLHAFASGVAAGLKKWTDERWRDVALACLAAGHAVCFTGGPADAGAADIFLRRHIPADMLRDGRARSLAGTLGLSELAWLLRRGAGAVSVNTGFAHLAALCGMPVVDLHGPTNPLRWGAVGPKVISLTAPGEDTAYLHLGFEIPPGAAPTLHRLGAEDALNALRRLGLTL